MSCCRRASGGRGGAWRRPGPAPASWTWPGGRRRRRRRRRPWPPTTPRRPAPSRRGSWPAACAARRSVAASTAARCAATPPPQRHLSEPIAVKATSATTETGPSHQFYGLPAVVVVEVEAESKAVEGGRLFHQRNRSFPLPATAAFGALRDVIELVSAAVSMTSLRRSRSCVSTCSADVSRPSSSAAAAAKSRPESKAAASPSKITKSDNQHEAPIKEYVYHGTNDLIGTE